MSDDRTALEQLFNVAVPGTTRNLLHYLYFSTKKIAKAAASKLHIVGFNTEVRHSADGSNWLVKATHEVIPFEKNIIATRKLMEEIACSLNGEYDGWEAEVKSSHSRSLLD